MYNNSEKSWLYSKQKDAVNGYSLKIAGNARNDRSVSASSSMWPCLAPNMAQLVQYTETLVRRRQQLG